MINNEDLGIKLINAIKENNSFTTKIILARILQENTDDEVKMYLCRNGILNKNECKFCTVKCGNKECNLQPKEQ